MRSVRGEAFRSTSRKLRNSSTSLSRPDRMEGGALRRPIFFSLGFAELIPRGDNRRRSFGFFNLIAIVTGAAELAFENGRRIGRDQFVAHEHEFRIHSVTRRLIN